MPLALTVALLTGCVLGGDGPSPDPSTPPASTPAAISGETMKLENPHNGGTVQIHIPDGWDGRSTAGTELTRYMLTVVPHDSPTDAIRPVDDFTDVPFLGLTHLERPTKNAEDLLQETMTTLSQQSENYTALTDLEPIEIDGIQFYGYRVTLTLGTDTESVYSIEDWTGDVGNDAYAFELRGGPNEGDFPTELRSAMESATFGV